MKNVLYKVLILSLLFGNMACENNEIAGSETYSHVKPTFVTALNPVDNDGVSYAISKNVIQGIASFENGWFVTQKSGNTILLINYLDENGVSLYHKRLYVNSHGQDLSLEQVSENELYLFTSKGTFGGTRNTGLLKLVVGLPEKINEVRDWSQTNISIDHIYDLNYTNATPCIDETKQDFAIRSNNSILIHSKTSIEANDYTTPLHFELNNAQLIDNGNLGMWFQGIAMKDQLVFCLTGNEKLTTYKSIFSYNQNGVVVEKYIFDANDFTQNLYDKFEPEGLSFSGNNLYFTIMTKSELEAGNIKYLYKITL